MFREGRHVQKIQGRMEKTTKTTSIIQPKIDEKSMNKWVAAPFLAKIEKITALGCQFSPKIDFLVDSGVPWGTQKSLPREAKEWSTLAMDPPGTNLGSFWAPDRFFLDFSTPFGCLWDPFGVPQGFILRKTVMNFQSFSWFRLVGRIGLLVVVLGCLARLVGLVG